jgi:hypothetical protein
MRLDLLTGLQTVAADAVSFAGRLLRIISLFAVHTVGTAWLNAETLYGHGF